MGDFSDNFIGIDDEFTGDGTAGTTRPHDTLLENQVDSSTRWLQRRRHLAPQNFAGPDGRQFASVYWMAIGYTPIYIDRSVESIDIYCASVLDYWQSSGGSTTVRARARLVGAGRTSSVFDWTDTVGSLTLQSVSLDTSGLTGSGYDILLLEILSQDEGTKDVDYDFGSSRWFLYANAGVNTPQPGTVVIDIKLNGDFNYTGMLLGYVEAGPGQAAGASTFSSGWPLLNTNAAVSPDFADPNDEEAFSGNVVSYISPRAIWYRVNVDDTQQSISYSPKNTEEMYANEPVLGQHTVKQAENLTAAYTRPELRAVGPQMIEQPNDSWTNFDENTDTYYSRWPQVKRSDGSTAIGDTTFMMSRDAAKIDVICYMLFYHSPIANLEYDNTKSLDGATQFAAIGDWDFTLDLIQLSDGNATWSASTDTLSETVSVKNVRHLVVGQNSTTPILQTMDWMHDGSETVGRFNHFMWYEGALIADYGDLAAIETVRITIDATTADFENALTLPMRARLTADPQGVVDYGLLSIDSESEDNVCCRLLSMSIFESGLA